MRERERESAHRGERKKERRKEKGEEKSQQKNHFAVVWIQAHGLCLQNQGLYPLLHSALPVFISSLVLTKCDCFELSTLVWWLHPKQVNKVSVNQKTSLHFAQRIEGKKMTNCRLDNWQEAYVHPERLPEQVNLTS